MKSMMLTVGFIGLCLLASFAMSKSQPAKQFTVIQPYQMQEYDQKITAIYQQLAKQPSLTRLDKLKWLSQTFLGTPYVLGSLGEGPTAKFDQDPLYRTDGFDCVTYMSTVLALLNAKDLADFKQEIVQVHYKHAHINYLSRNHFTSIDWNVNNQQAGYLEDITAKLFPKQVKTASALIDKPNWYAAKSSSALKLLPANTTPPQTLLTQLRELGQKTKQTQSELNYVPLTALFNEQGQAIAAMFDRIPDGVIIEIVRPNWPLKHKIGTNLQISHLGLGLRINGQLIFREASSKKGQVIDIPLQDYLQPYLKSPTIKGIHIQRIL